MMTKNELDRELTTLQQGSLRHSTASSGDKGEIRIRSDQRQSSGQGDLRQNRLEPLAACRHASIVSDFMAGDLIMFLNTSHSRASSSNSLSQKTAGYGV